MEAPVVVKGKLNPAAFIWAAPPAPAGRYPADVVESARATCVLTNSVFLDIVDEYFRRSPCLCCYSARSFDNARDAYEALNMLRNYFNPSGCVKSKAFDKILRSLSRDLTPAELKRARKHVAESASPAVRRINRYPGICVARPECRPDTLWVYSTPEGRRLLRHLTRRSAVPLRVAVVSSSSSVFPRVRLRLYSAVALGPPGCSPSFESIALQWLKKTAARRPKLTGPSCRVRPRGARRGPRPSRPRRRSGGKDQSVS